MPRARIGNLCLGYKGNPFINEILEYNSEWYRQPILGIKLINRQYDVIFIFHANKDIRRVLPILRYSYVWSHQYPDIIPGISEKQIIYIDKPMHGILRRMEMLKKIHNSAYFWN